VPNGRRQGKGDVFFFGTEEKGMLNGKISS
jgi:hypothetical protein